jgi:hypothetical protein
MDNMGYDTYTKSYEATICPIINYGSEVWGYIKNCKADTVQNKAMRVFLGVHRFAATPAIEGDMGWFPNTLQRTLNVLRYWNRLINMNDNRLTKKVFLHEYEHCKKGSWCYFVKNTLEKLDLFYLYNEKSSCDLSICKEKLIDNYKKQWVKDVEKKPKLLSYVQFKKSYETELFVKLNLERNQRSMLAQLRCGTLPLHIETGRFSNKKVEDRICTICNSGDIESEYHFLFHCNFYNQERTVFYESIDQIVQDKVDHEKLGYLFKNNCRKLAKYVCKIFKQRQDKIYDS